MSQACEQRTASTPACTYSVWRSRLLAAIAAVMVLIPYTASPCRTMLGALGRSS